MNGPRIIGARAILAVRAGDWKGCCRLHITVTALGKAPTQVKRSLCEVNVAAPQTRSARPTTAR
jgi:hypothetical protein